MRSERIWANNGRVDHAQEQRTVRDAEAALAAGDPMAAVILVASILTKHELELVGMCDHGERAAVARYLAGRHSVATVSLAEAAIRVAKLWVRL